MATLCAHEVQTLTLLECHFITAYLSALVCSPKYACYQWKYKKSYKVLWWQNFTAQERDQISWSHSDESTLFPSQKGAIDS